MSVESKFLSQFGEELYLPSSKTTVKTKDVLSGKIVMIYFSAHWCPPCRRFTPMLMEFYNKLKSTDSNQPFELVFCSLDRSQAEYDEYVSDFPWHCVPFADTKDLRTKLAMTYKAQGIPHLVVVDNNPNKRSVITQDGTTEVQMDPLGNNFPWTPQTFDELLPKQLITKDGLVDTVSSLDGKYVMLYFSAHWCPPCKMFTPKLCEAYKTLKASSVADKFELLFVSSDRDEESFQEYYGSMPFWAIPFEEREAKGKISKKYGIRGIPSLLILGPVPNDGGDRPVINASLRGIIEGGNDLVSEFPFHPKPYADLAGGDADGINDHRSLVVFCENEDDEEQAEIVQMIQKISQEMVDDNAYSSDMKFFYATQPGGMVDAVRKVLKLENKRDTVVMVLLDIPDNGGYYLSDETDLSEDKIRQFIKDPGVRQQLKP
mmetsp:Transcript_24994/g.44302  ORF Transcript_24994/g.44302 Transcript_24994/m.44302 type:complete len:431 (-) Transcript_24994:139-1431(-)